MKGWNNGGWRGRKGGGNKKNLWTEQRKRIDIKNGGHEEMWIDRKRKMEGREEVTAEGKIWKSKEGRKGKEEGRERREGGKERRREGGK